MECNKGKGFDRSAIGQYLYDVAYLLNEITTWEDLESYIRMDGNKLEMAVNMNIDDLKKQYDDVNAAVDSILWNYCCYNIARCWANSNDVNLQA